MTSQQPGRAVRTWLLALLLVVLPLLAPTPAAAHALLVTSTPADGQTLETAPRQVRLEFSEAVQVAASSAELSAAQDATERIATGTPTGAEPGATATVLVIPLPDLARGSYLLRWRTISAEDLHPTSGALVFGVGQQVSAGTADPASPLEVGGSVVEAILRWLALLALGTALAALVIRWRQAASASTSGVKPPAACWVVPLAGCGAAATTALALLYLLRIALVMGVVPVLAAWTLTLRWAVAVLTSLGAWQVLRARRNPDRAAMALLTVALVAITSTSHAAAAGLAWAVVSAIHTVATMLWCGGVIVVGLTAVPALRTGMSVGPVRVARAFTPVALVCVPVSLVTGLLLSGRLLPSVGAVLHTGYGQALLVKVAVLVLGLACAGGTVLLLVLGGGRRHSDLVLGAEAVLLGGVVLAASALGAIHPASPVKWAPAPRVAPTSGTLSDLTADLVITANVGPGRPGRNFVLINVLDTRRPAPEAVTAVRVSLAGAAALAATEQGAGQWLAVVDVAGEGSVPVQIWADREGLPTATTTFTWQVAPPAGTRIGGAALAPYVDLAGGLLGVACLLAAGVYLWRRRRRTLADGAPGDPSEVSGLHRPQGVEPG